MHQYLRVYMHAIEPSFEAKQLDNGRNAVQVVMSPRELQKFAIKKAASIHGIWY